ncbi:MAG: DUF1294 domain-containing protein [Bacteroidales bacterium]|nr:DUF1294 domain-containing protein [Bacteroidales bacterium]
MKLIIAYIIVINLTSFLMYGADKRRGIAKKRRIRESSLLLITTIGGSIGALSAMSIFHHKTKHFKFRFFVPFLLILHIILFIYIFRIHAV